MSLRATINSDRLRYREWTTDHASPQVDPPHQCGCIGPQDGNPVCPCRMRSLRVQHGRFVEIIDHGPAPARDDLDV